MTAVSAMGLRSVRNTISRMTMSKYHNHRCKVGDEVLDSIKEAQRYKELLLLEKAGIIKDLQRQVKFVLIPTQRDEVTKKVIERERSYYADFVYYMNGERVVEDVKGMRTEVYKLKKALMLYHHGIRIKET